MKCANCDAKIKDGSIYCPVCGKEAQMVSGYSSLEDDFLHSLLREGSQTFSKKKRHLTPEELQRNAKRNQRTLVIVTCLIFAIIITIGIVIKLFVDYKNNNSYDYQMEKAQEELIDHNYETALNYLARALVIHPDDVESRMKMAEIYLLKEEQDAAIVLLTEVIRLDADEEKAYQYLIDIYEEKEQYTKIQALASYTDDKEVEKMLAAYFVESPVIEPEGDTYRCALDVKISSAAEQPIYYTLDGTDPIQYGKRYIVGLGIRLDESGLYMLRAVCKNEKGIYSEVAKESYQIVIMPEETEATEVLEVTE